MLSRVPIRQKSLDRYRPLADPAHLKEIERLAGALRGVRVLQLNATAYGGGVAELLLSLVALERGLGLDVEWMTIGGDNEFFTSRASAPGSTTCRPMERKERRADASH